MANNIAFQPMGPTVRIFAATANAQGNVVSITAVSPCQQFWVMNPDKNDPVFSLWAYSRYYGCHSRRFLGQRGGNSPIYGQGIHWPTG